LRHNGFPSTYPVRTPSLVAIEVYRTCSMPSSAAAGATWNRVSEVASTTV
jgi:hypothetical protein